MTASKTTSKTRTGSKVATVATASKSRPAAKKAAPKKPAPKKVAAPKKTTAAKKTVVKKAVSGTVAARKVTLDKTAAGKASAKKTTKTAIAKKVENAVKTPEQILAEGLANGEIAQDVMENMNMNVNETATVQVPPTPSPAASQPVASEAAAPVANKVERIMLPANMEMSGLEESYSVLRSKYPPTYEKCILDGAEMNVIDASGIQLLVNFVSSIKSKGCEVEWDNYSIHAYQLANELGLVVQMGD